MHTAGLLAIVACFAAGCSGSHDHRLARDQFVQRATSICRASKKKLMVLPQPPEHSLIATYLSYSVRLQAAEVASLRKLDPPASDSAQFRLFLDQMTRTIDVIENELIPPFARGHLNRKEMQRVKRISHRLEAMDARNTTLAARLGIGVCAISVG